ncbi:hypothetical protein MMC28_005438 [Mycoblastus sanguinarius]|nr:hypothetical protein [Mycoblastus sanguinarius]
MMDGLTSDPKANWAKANCDDPDNREVPTSTVDPPFTTLPSPPSRLTAPPSLVRLQIIAPAGSSSGVDAWGTASIDKMPAAYEIRAGGDVKNKKQSMADLKLRRLNELNSRLREDLDRPRIKVSEASMSLIQYCTDTKDFMVPSMWGSFAQELLSTFSTSLGEVSLVPSTGGVFTVDIVHSVSESESEKEAIRDGHELGIKASRLWDRKTDGGFPEVKHLKQLVRNIVDPTRDLGHVDRHQKDEKAKQSSSETPPSEAEDRKETSQPSSVKAPESSTDSKGKTITLVDPDCCREGRSGGGKAVEERGRGV